MGYLYYPIKINEFILEVPSPLSSFNRGLVRAWPLQTLIILEPVGGKRGPESETAWVSQSRSLVSIVTVPLDPGLPPEIRGPS